jgi:hypothetical protein
VAFVMTLPDKSPVPGRPGWRGIGIAGRSGIAGLSMTPPAGRRTPRARKARVISAAQLDRGLHDAPVTYLYHL